MSKPRIRVKARRSTVLKIGGVAAMFGGYSAEFQSQLGKIFDRGAVYKILLAKSGDYDRYLVIHD